MKLKDFNTEEHFKQSFKKVFGEDIDISGYYFWRTCRNAKTNS